MLQLEGNVHSLHSFLVTAMLNTSMISYKMEPVAQVPYYEPNKLKL